MWCRQKLTVSDSCIFSTDALLHQHYAYISFRRKKVGVSTNILLKEAMNQNSYSELLPLAKKIVITSFIIQGFGFILNAIAFLIEGFSFDQALWHSLFHTS